VAGVGDEIGVRAADVGFDGDRAFRGRDPLLFL